MWVRATFGSHSFFCSSEPNSLSGCGNADRLVRGQQRGQRGVPHPVSASAGCSRPARARARRTPSGSSCPSAPICLSPSTTSSGIFASRSICERVDLVLQERRGARRGTARRARVCGRRTRGCGWIRSRRRWPEEQLLAEARQRPFGLARCLGDLAGLLLADLAHRLLQGVAEVRCPECYPRVALPQPLSGLACCAVRSASTSARRRSSPRRPGSDRW